jgi:hypothetical protein
VFRLLESLITRRSSRSLEYKAKQLHYKERLSILARNHLRSGDWEKE